MKFPLPALLLAAALPASASLTWTGAGDAISLYQEANWLDDNGFVPTAGQVDPNTAVTATTGGLIEIVSGTGTPSNFGGTFIVGTGNSLTVSNGKILASGGGSPLTGGGAGTTLTISNGATLGVGAITQFDDIVVNGGTIDLVGTAGITMLNDPTSTISILNGGSIVTQFITSGAMISVDGTSSIEFLGGGDPINSQITSTTVDLATGGMLILVSEAEIDEHIGQGEIFVNGTLVTAGNRDSLLSISGGTATALIPEPTVSLLGGLALLAFLRRKR